MSINLNKALALVAEELAARKWVDNNRNRLKIVAEVMHGAAKRTEPLVQAARAKLSPRMQQLWDVILGG